MISRISLFGICPWGKCVFATPPPPPNNQKTCQANSFNSDGPSSALQQCIVMEMGLRSRPCYTQTPIKKSVLGHMPAQGGWVWFRRGNISHNRSKIFPRKFCKLGCPRNARWQYIATRMLLSKPQLVTLMFTGVFELDYDLPVSPYLFKYWDWKTI